MSVTQIYDDMLLCGITEEDVATLVKKHMERLDTKVNIAQSCDHRTLDRYLKKLNKGLE